MLHGTGLYQMKNGDASRLVKEIHNNIVRVECEDGANQLSPSGVVMVSSNEHDMVLVTGGANVGAEGELVFIDGTDVILTDFNKIFQDC